MVTNLIKEATVKVASPAPGTDTLGVGTEVKEVGIIASGVLINYTKDGVDCYGEIEDITAFSPSIFTPTFKNQE